MYSEQTPDDGHMNCPKHVEFHDKLICEISASSWFYCKEICYDAQSHGRKILHNLITIRVITAALYDISLDVAGVSFFVLNMLMHAFVVHCFVSCLINLLMNGAWKLKSMYNYLDIF